MAAKGDGMGVLFCRQGQLIPDLARAFQEPVLSTTGHLIQNESAFCSAHARTVSDLPVACMVETRAVRHG